MTLQMSDSVTYRRPWSQRKRIYSLAASSGTGLFDPREHGLVPEDRLTALYCGFLSEYAVVQDQLVLDTLNIFQDDDVGLELFGVLPYIETEGLGFSIYRALSHPVPFTGGHVDRLRFGRGVAVSGRHVHSGVAVLPGSRVGV
jgi:hypothetical protein